MTNFGILITSPTNIGEEIQQLASLRFLLKIDEYVHRDRISDFKSTNEQITKLIMNGWWMWDESKFPPSKYIEPLMISMFFRKGIRNHLLSKNSIKYLKQYAPIGCRDIDCVKWLEENGIPAYFSGCLTLTLEPNKNIQKQDYILCVDVEERVLNEIRKRTDREVYNIPVDINPLLSYNKRIELAKIYLRLYQEASCVISNRLHAILPALALNTPVLRLDTERNEREINRRFSGYNEFINSVTKTEFLLNKNIYNFDNPPNNSDKYLLLKENLIKKCSDFTGIDTKKSFVNTSNNPIMDLLSCSLYEYEQIKKALLWSKKSDLYNAYIRKMFFKVAKYDFKPKTL